MSEIHLYTQKDLTILTKELGPGSLYHGTPQTLTTLGRLAESDEPVLVPHLARNRNNVTNKHIPRHPNRLMSVGFHDAKTVGSAAMRSLLHPDNHPNLAPIDCAHGYDITPSGELEFSATAMLASDVTEATIGSLLITTRHEVEEVNRNMPGFIPDGDFIRDYSGQTGNDPHDFWSMAAITPYTGDEIIVHGSFFLEQFSAGRVAVAQPFPTDYNRQ